MRTLFFLQFAPDAEILRPLAETCARQGEVSVLATAETAARFPGLRRDFGFARDFRTMPRLLLEWGWGAPLAGVKTLVTCSESSARPHRAAHRLAERANRAGIQTLTLQHGYENVGLTYSDIQYPIERVHFASRTVLIWGPMELLEAGISARTKDKCLSVGYPKRPAAAGDALPVPKKRRTVSVFENLHWSRYGASFRRRFLDDVGAVARRFPDISFIFRPHPDQRWTARRFPGIFRGLDNVLFADPADPKWRPYTAESILSMSDAVITTPSTVALDAASKGIPAAVAAYDLPLERYAPLTLLRGPQDWAGFVEDVLNPSGIEKSKKRSADFFRRVTVPGDAVSKIACLL